MAIYEGARQRTVAPPRVPRLERQRRTVDAPPPVPRAAGPVGRRAAPRDAAGSAVLLGVIVVAFVCAFFSLSQSVRVSELRLRGRPTSRRAGRPPGPRAGPPERPQPAGRGPADPEAGHRRGPRTAVPAAHHPRALIDRYDARSHGLPPPIARRAARLRRGGLEPRRPAGVLAGRPQRRARGGRGRSRHRSAWRSPAVAARSTTGPGPWSWPRPSSATSCPRRRSA